MMSVCCELPQVDMRPVLQALIRCRTNWRTAALADRHEEAVFWATEAFYLKQYYGVQTHVWN